MRIGVVTLAILGLLLIACGGGAATATPTETPPPTSTPLPTATPTPSPTATPTPTPIPTATPVPTPSPSPTPTVTPAATPAPTATATSKPAPPSELASYKNDLFGVSIDYPAEWEVEEVEGLSQLGVQLATFTRQLENGLPVIEIDVFYSGEVFSASDISDQLVPFILSFPNSSVISESEVLLKGDVPAFQITFGFGPPSDERRGVMQTAVRGSQSVLVILITTREDFEESLDLYLDVLSSVLLGEPTPFGIPRDEALTLSLADAGPITLDPAIATESRSIQYISQIFGGLATFDEDMNLVPDLAEPWDISQDGTVFTFTLKSNARFHDGRSVTAEDVKYSWERVASPDTGSTIAATYLGDIVGFEEFHAGQADEISGIEVVDERTLRVTIDAPKVYFAAKLAHSSAYVVDRANVEEGGEEWWREPNGTGPFKLKGWTDNLVLAMERNDDYHLTPAKVPYVVFRLFAGIPFGGVPSLMYEAGEVDAAIAFADELEAFQDPENPLSNELNLYPQLSVNYVGFNSQVPPFDDVKVRQAFLTAVDRPELVRQIFGETAQVADGFLPPGLPGYNPDLVPLAFNPEEAIALLQESSYGGAENLPDIVFTSAGFGVPSSIDLFLLDSWSQNLDIEIQLRLLDPGLYYYQLDENLDNLFDYGWIADYPDPQNFLDVLFHSTAENNVGRYSKDEVDDLLEEARLEQDQDARFALYRQAEEILRDEAAAIPLYFGRNFMLVKPYVKDFSLNPQGGLSLSQVSLEPRE